MRNTLVRLGTAMLVAVGLIIPATAVPAQADVTAVIGIIKTVYSLYKQFLGGGSSGLTLDQAVSEITAEIQNSQAAIISQIDEVATANVRSCATSAVINFADIDALTPDNLQSFALDATSCVTQAQSLISAETDQASIDQAGFAMNTVGPLALMARAKAGLTTPALTSVLISGENTLITALLPSCSHVDQTGGEPGTGHVFFWECTAYNGGTGEAKQEAASQDQATSNTSRAIAEAELPILNS